MGKMIPPVPSAKQRLIVLLLIFLLVFTFTFVRLFEANRLNCAQIEQVDVVYTWVNGSDPKFAAELRQYLNNKNASSEKDVSEQRFSDKYELKFSLRSLEKYAPWIRHVFIVTNGQIPYWLDLDYEKVSVVSHRDLFLDSYDLPSFSSPAIESHLHRIPGLSKRFVYFNDDVFLGAPTYLGDFMSESRGVLVYMAWPLPMCAPDCPWMYVADGECDGSCFNAECQMDGGDCEQPENDNENNVVVFNAVTLQSGEVIETDYEGDNRGFLRNLVQIKNDSVNLTDLISEHNKKVMFINKINRRKKYLNTNSTLIDKLRKRTSFDAYGASLQHTNRVFNKHYGFKVRQVPAHAPIMIDRDVMEDLQANFRREFQVTSRNRFRHADDMQFSFSYYHFLVEEQKEVTIGEIFDQFDSDGSGTWSDREIRTLLTQLYELPLTYQIVEYFERVLVNCTEKSENNPEVSTPEFERYIDSRLPTITKQIVANCLLLGQILKLRFGKIPKYKTHIIKNSENNYVTFKMLTSNISDVVSHLDEIRQNTKKFVCLNDNLNEAKTSENELVKAVLYDFYLSLYPKPSKFELRSDLRNRFLYLEELEEWRKDHFKIKLCMYFFVVVLCYITIFNVCKVRYFCRVFNKIVK